MNSWLIIDDCKVHGKISAVMKRFTIERIVGDIALEIFFSIVVGTVSRSQYESDAWMHECNVSTAEIKIERKNERKKERKREREREKERARRGESR